MSVGVIWGKKNLIRRTILWFSGWRRQRRRRRHGDVEEDGFVGLEEDGEDYGYGPSNSIAFRNDSTKTNLFADPICLPLLAMGSACRTSLIKYSFLSLMFDSFSLWWAACLALAGLRIISILTLFIFTCDQAISFPSEGYSPLILSGMLICIRAWLCIPCCVWDLEGVTMPDIY